MLLKNRIQKLIVLHPVFFAVFPVLSLWLYNSAQTPFYAASRAFLIMAIVLVLSFAASLVIYRNAIKAGLLTSLTLWLFILYGRLFAAIDMFSVGGFILGRHRFLLPVWGLIFITGLIAIWRLKQTPYTLNHILNLVGLFLVAFVGLQAAAYSLQTNRFTTRPRVVDAKGAALAANASAAIDGPDVYYILMDGYSRDDVLRAMGGPDVSGFYDALSQLGFSVQRCSQSNYDSTTLSMSSALNMDYLDHLGVPFYPDEKRLQHNDFTELLQQSKVRQEFESFGYQFYTFKAVYEWMNIEDSSHYYNFEDNIPLYNRQESINFQYLFLETTIFRPLLEIHVNKPEAFERMPLFLLQLFYPKADMFSTREYKQYQQNLFALKALSEIPGQPGKKFVYAHLFNTHQPYVFTPDGGFRWPPKDSKEAYFDQIVYANKRLIEVIQKILADSKKPPVIIVQSDHGYPFTPDRTRILNAYYLPNGGDKVLYPGITPVNSFRLVLSQYFSRKYDLLPDKSFHSNHDFPYQVTEVSPSCSAPQH